MHRIKRLLAFFLILFVVLIGLAVAIPIVYKAEIVQLIQADLNKNLNADVSFNEDVSISLLKSFPNLNVSIEDLTIVGKDRFEADTLVHCKQISTTVGLKKLYYNHEIDLQYLELDDPYLQLLSTPDGDNWEIFNATEADSTSINLSADFKEVLIHSGRLIYHDSAQTTSVDLKGIEGKFNGNYTDDVFDLFSDFTCNSAYIAYDNIPYVNNIPVETKATTAIDLLTDNYRFKENEFKAGSIRIIAEGGMQFIGDSTDIDISYASKDAKLKDLIALTPAYYTEDIQRVTMSGESNINGTVKGIISETQLPGYTFFMQVADGLLAHPDMTSPLQDIKLNLRVENSDGKDESLELDLTQFAFNLANNPFAAQVYSKDPFGNAFINGQIAGKLDLEELNKLIPKEYQTTVLGKIDCDLAVQGKLLDIEETADLQQINTMGKISLNEVMYTNNEVFPQPLNISKGELNFSQNDIDVSVLNVKAGKSDLLLTGQVRNWLGYLFKEQILSGKVTMFSDLLDAGDFMLADESEEESDLDSLLTLPDNLNVDVVYDFEELQYDKHTFSHVIGEAGIADNTLNIKQLSSALYGGQVTLGGSFNTTNANTPLADLNLVIQDLDIQKAFESFETLRILAPIFEQIKGQFSSTLKLKTELLKDFSPNLSNITCQGVLDLFNCDVESLTTLSEIGTKLDLADFKKPVKINDLLLSFSVKDGKIEVDPFSVPVGESTLNMMGYSKLDRSIKFDGLLSVPKQLYAQGNSSMNRYIPKTTLSALDSFEWSDLEFDVNVVGTYKKPKVEIDYKATKQRVADNVKSQIKSKIDDRKDVLKKQAQDKMDAAKKRAEEEKRIAEEKARQALEEQKKRVAEQLRKEKEEANKKIEEELRKKRKELLKNKIPLPPK